MDYIKGIRSCSFHDLIFPKPRTMVCLCGTHLSALCHVYLGACWRERNLLRNNHGCSGRLLPTQKSAPPMSMAKFVSTKVACDKILIKNLALKLGQNKAIFVFLSIPCISYRWKGLTIIIG